MKNVLVLLHDDEGQEARLQAALDLTRALSGHLNCLDVAVPPAVVSDDFIVPGGATAMAYERDRESQNRSSIEARLRKEDVSWRMLDTIGEPGRALKNAADLADIIVISGPGSQDDPVARHLVAEVAVNSGRPVLVVPPSCRRLDVMGGVLVGWNGSREASEAVRAAVPLLQHAASVTLLDVNHPAGDYSVDEAASYLSRHGIQVDIVEESTSGPVSDVILQRAHGVGASYIVIGAYGVPRWVEACLGGVTLGMLQKSDLPILMAH
jgi:nucleotide-binding universal stress UspA family protein